MKSDLYTRTILTLIAVCLVWICLKDLTPTASAQTGRVPPSPVVIVDERGVPLITPQGLHVNIGDQAVPVVVGNKTLSIILTGIERQGSWQPIQVDVLRQPPTLMPTP